MKNSPQYLPESPFIRPPRVPLDYNTPFTLSNCEQYYQTVWAKLDNLKSYNQDKDL